MGGVGVKYLDESLKAIKGQTYKDFEVVISDHSTTNDIEDLCKLWTSELEIQYHRNTNKRGSSSANINNAMRHAKGDITKILFQDDYLYGDDSLEIQLKYFTDNQSTWLATAYRHINQYVYGTTHNPSYNDNIQYGRNTIGAPSGVMIKSDIGIEFDESLIWLMDCDYYKRVYDVAGLPTICNEPTVVNREHEQQVTNVLATNQIKEKELSYIKRKYGNTN